MLLRILQRDLKRKKTTNIILLLFIIAATMFVASGLNNVITVMNGTDYYLDQAGVEDYVILTMGNNATGHIKEALNAEKEVSDYRIEPIVFGGDGNIFLENGTEAKLKNTMIFQSIDDSAIRFFDMDNNEITAVEEGHVYVSGQFLKTNDLTAGDKITIKHSGTELTLILDGKAKDALLGSDFMGNARCILNDNDMQTLLGNPKIYDYYRGECAYIDTDDVNALSVAASNIPSVSLSCARATFKMCYVMDLIVAFIVLIMSVCLIFVSFAVLKFSINFTITEEYREIGVMKAIGIRNAKIRSLYIIKYLTLALIGAGIGLASSFPFGQKLISSVSDNMVLGNSYGAYINVFGAILVVLVIGAFAYHCTGKVKKSSPVDAIRQGQTGERYKKKAIYRIGKSNTGASAYMAINDIVSSPARFLTIILSFFICTLFVLMLVNTTNTMNSNKLLDALNGSKGDLFMSNSSEALALMNADSKTDVQKKMDEFGAKSTDNGMPAKFSIEMQYKYKFSFEGKNFYMTFQQGVGTKAGDYKYIEGTAPQNANEIAITTRVSKMTGAKIGDTLTVDFGNEKKDCIVTAYFSSMSQLGELIRLYDTAPTDMKYCCSVLQYEIRFMDDPTTEEIEDRKERIKILFDNDSVYDEKEYCVRSVGVLDTMKSVQWMLLAITIVVVLLVTLLMERAFIADEKSQIAILKAIGFRDKDIIRWHTLRLAIAGFLAVILAGVLSIPMTKLCISPIFGMMGTSDIDFNIVPVQVFFIYPGIIIAATLVIAWLTAQYTRTIHCSDTANIE